MSSTFGKVFKITTFGESHGSYVGCIVDGCPPGIPITVFEIQEMLDKRRPGGKYSSNRKEKDAVEVLSGIYEGKTLGTPIAMIVKNSDTRSSDYDELKQVFRPSHADYTTFVRYGIRDHRGGGRASARETVGRVAAGAIARKVLIEKTNIDVLSWIDSIGEVKSNFNINELNYDNIRINNLLCPDKEAASKMAHLIDEVRLKGDSIGGVVGCIVKNVPAGLGDPIFDKLDADIAKAMLSIPASRGIEFGAGFKSATMKGSVYNDQFVLKDGKIGTKTNYSGGIQGGISNGENIIFRIAFKPTPSISIRQSTIDIQGRKRDIKIKGRHDPCVAIRAVSVVEAMTWIVLVDHFLSSKSLLRC